MFFDVGVQNSPCTGSDNSRPQVHVSRTPVCCSNACRSCLSFRFRILADGHREFVRTYGSVVSASSSTSIIPYSIRADNIDHPPLLKDDNVLFVVITEKNSFPMTLLLHFANCIFEEMRLVAAITFVG